MSEFKQQLADWRSSVAKSFKRREDLLDELQNHLEEEAVTQRQQGHDVETSFAVAVERLGDVHLLASEFHKIQPVSVAWPPVIIVWIALAMSMIALTSMASPKAKLGGTDALMAFHMVSISLGYFATLALGTLGLAFLGTRLFRGVPDAQLRYLLHHACIMAVIAASFTGLGIVVGSVFCPRPKVGPFWGGLCEREIGGIAVLLWNIMAASVLVRFRQRAMRAAPLMIVAATGNAVVVAGWLGAMELEQQGHGLGFPIILALVALPFLLATTALVPTGTLRRLLYAANDSA